MAHEHRACRHAQGGDSSFGRVEIGRFGRFRRYARRGRVTRLAETEATDETEGDDTRAVRPYQDVQGAVGRQIGVT